MKDIWNKEVLLIICKYKTCDFILMQSADFDRFQMMHLLNATWLLTNQDEWREGGIDCCVVLWRRNAREGKIMVALCNFTLCDSFLEHSYCIK